jgi:hypothetical protein
MLKFFIVICIGAGLLACSSVTEVFLKPSIFKLDATYPSNSSIDSIVKPYKDSLAKEMNIVIGTSTVYYYQLLCQTIKIQNSKLKNKLDVSNFLYE